MKLFLDTANIQEIRQGARLGVVSGVTTNPSLAAKEGIGHRESDKTAVQEIAGIIDGPISVEVVSQDAAGMIAEGREIADWIPNPWVKIPSTPEGFEAIAALARDGIPINQTLCFSVNQALLGAQAGSTVVSPFVGRLADIASIYRHYEIKTMGMAASIRHPLPLRPRRAGRVRHRHRPVWSAAADGRASLDRRGRRPIFARLAGGCQRLSEYPTG